MSGKTFVYSEESFKEEKIKDIINKKHKRYFNKIKKHIIKHPEKRFKYYHKRFFVSRDNQYFEITFPVNQSDNAGFSYFPVKDKKLERTLQRKNSFIPLI